MAEQNPDAPTIKRTGIRETDGVTIVGERWELPRASADLALEAIGNMASAGSEQAVELLLGLNVHPERREGLQSSRPIIEDPTYGEEVAIKLANGFQIRTAAGAEGEPLFGGSYVRIVKDDGSENGYWHADEWQADPVGVMGAILASASGIELRRA